MKNKFMQRAIELSIESINSGGGPFGSVIVKDEKIISEGMNRVTVDNDPTSVSYTHLTQPTILLV